jgi:hypothetical protein
VVEINIRIHKVLDLGANPDPRAGAAPFREGVASTRVCLFQPILVAYAILSSYRLSLCRVLEAPVANHGV